LAGCRRTFARGIAQAAANRQCSTGLLDFRQTRGISNSELAFLLVIGDLFIQLGFAMFELRNGLR
jgi:hypothetical protein